MSILLKNAVIKDEASSFYNQKVDVLIVDGVISSIDSSIDDLADTIINCHENWLTCGFYDIGTALNEPGYECKEDLESLANVAMSSGYTHLAPLSNTKPVIEHRDQIKLLKGNLQGVEIAPIPALTKGNKGTELTDMLDLASVGAKVFSDGVKTTWHPGILMKSLQYLQYIDGLVLPKAVS